MAAPTKEEGAAGMAVLTNPSKNNIGKLKSAIRRAGRKFSLETLKGLCEVNKVTPRRIPELINWLIKDGQERGDPRGVIYALDWINVLYKLGIDAKAVGDGDLHLLVQVNNLGGNTEDRLAAYERSVREISATSKPSAQDQSG